VEYVLSFSPWIAFAVFSSAVNWRVGVIVAFVTQAVLARSLIRKHQLDLLSIPALSTGALAAIALVSLLAAKPFTLAIVRRTTPEALWSRPEFISLNRFLTSVWAASFAAAAIACALVIDLVKHDAALVSHPAFDGDFDARFSLAEGEVTEHAKSEEVFTGAAGPRGASGVRVWASDRACRERPRHRV
jgi:hypothetical protein